MLGIEIFAAARTTARCINRLRIDYVAVFELILIEQRGRKDENERLIVIMRSHWNTQLRGAIALHGSSHQFCITNS